MAEFSMATLRERAWAFDGTLESLGASEDSHLGQVPSATFTVNRWYKGGAGAKVTVQYETGTGSALASASAVGSRMLVAGEPRWGGQALDDAVAWGCGFTTEWTEAAERSWAESFGSRGDAVTDSASLTNSTTAATTVAVRSFVCFNVAGDPGPERFLAFEQLVRADPATAGLAVRGGYRANAAVSVAMMPGQDSQAWIAALPDSLSHHELVGSVDTKDYDCGEVKA